MTTDYIDRSTSLIGRVHGLELAPHAIQLLAKGEPVDLEQLAAASGWRVDDVDAALDAQTSAERDERGRLVGLALTLRPTSHRFTVDGRTLYAWCASDTLMFPVILGRPGTVDSTCPHTGQPIHLEVTPEQLERIDPPGAVLSAVRPPGALADVRAQTCHHGHFFSCPPPPHAGETSTPTATASAWARRSGSTARSSPSSAGLPPGRLAERPGR